MITIKNLVELRDTPIDEEVGDYLPGIELEDLHYFSESALLQTDILTDEVLTEGVGSTIWNKIKQGFQAVIKFFKTLGVKIASFVRGFFKKAKDDVSKTESQTQNFGNEIERCIREKDIKNLRGAIAVTAFVDRTFATGEFEKTLKYAESKGIKVKEDKLIGELISTTKDPSEYTQDDFSTAVFELKENFCDERIEDVKKIGRTLYGTKEQKEKIIKAAQSNDAEFQMVYYTIRETWIANLGKHFYEDYSCIVFNFFNLTNSLLSFEHIFSSSSRLYLLKSRCV